MLDGVVGCRQPHRLALHANLTAIWVLQPIEDIHKGALARTVLTQQSMNLALIERERDIVIRQHPRKPFCDMPGFQHGIGHSSSYCATLARRIIIPCASESK